MWPTLLVPNDFESNDGIEKLSNNEHENQILSLPTACTKHGCGGISDNPPIHPLFILLHITLSWNGLAMALFGASFVSFYGMCGRKALYEGSLLSQPLQPST